MRIPRREALPTPTEAMQYVLGVAIKYQVDTGDEWMPEAHLVLQRPPELKPRLLATLRELVALQLLESSGHDTFRATAAGLVVAHAYMGHVTGALETLLAFFKGRLNADGTKFREYSSASLVAAHVDPASMPLVAAVIAAFDLSAGGTTTIDAAGKPCWTWRVPPINEFVSVREMGGWGGLYDRRQRALDAQAVREEEQDRRRSAAALAPIGFGGGEIHMGDKININIGGGAAVGAVAVGSNASATGSASSAAGPVTPERVEADILAARKALLHDEKQMKELAAGMYETFEQVLRKLAAVQVQQGEVATVARQLKDAVDDLWVEQMLPKLKDGELPAALEVTKAILSSPVLAAALTMAGGGG